MNILPIVTIKDGNPVLTTRATEVADINDPKIQELITDMIPTMYKKDGVGLAATQVGHGLRIAVLIPNPHKFDKYKDKASEAIVIINPVITSHSLFKESGEEGCLSVPDIVGMVKRWKKVTVTFQDRTGKKQTMKANGLLARCFQHEIDHLDGILFVDRADKLFRIEALEQ